LPNIHPEQNIAGSKKEESCSKERIDYKKQRYKRVPYVTSENRNNNTLRKQTAKSQALLLT
jgi:hypothetical protein